MNIKRTLATVGGFAFLGFFLGLGPAPSASAQASTDGNVVLADGPVVPQPCSDCTTHNQQPGNGPGIYTAGHACDVSTGQGYGLYFLGNPNSTPVTYNFNSVSGTGAVEHNYTGTIPAHAGTGSVPTVNLQVADVDRNQSIHLVGTLAGRPINQTFNCPCLQPQPTTSTTPTPPSSTTPGSPTTPPGSSSPVVTSHLVGTLPATGSSVDSWIIGLGILSVGALLVGVARRRRSEAE